MPKSKRIWNSTYVECYAPNSVRWENRDEELMCYHIYINDELYEICPLEATEQEATMRLHDIMDELWIEGNDEPVRKKIN